jgi:hypothetical protein
VSYSSSRQHNSSRGQSSLAPASAGTTPWPRASCDPQGRARLPTDVPDERCRSGGHLAVHRGLLQPQPDTLEPRQPESCQIRGTAAQLWRLAGPQPHSPDVGLERLIRPPRARSEDLSGLPAHRQVVDLGLPRFGGRVRYAASGSGPLGRNRSLDLGRWFQREGDRAIPTLTWSPMIPVGSGQLAGAAKGSFDRPAHTGTGPRRATDEVARAGGGWLCCGHARVTRSCESPTGPPASL